MTKSKHLSDLTGESHLLGTSVDKRPVTDHYVTLWKRQKLHDETCQLKHRKNFHCHNRLVQFYHKHNATDVKRLKGVCNWHADSKNVNQSCFLYIECLFLSHKPFLRIWQHIQPALRKQTTCVHTNPGPPRPACSPLRTLETNSLHHQRISVRNCLREAHLHVCRAHWGLDVTPVHCRNRLH